MRSCATCPKLLTSSDVRRGTRRCRACRRASPLRYQARKGLGTPDGIESLLIGRAATRAASASSWWVGLSWDALSREAVRRFVSAESQP